MLFTNIRRHLAELAVRILAHRASLSANATLAAIPCPGVIRELFMKRDETWPDGTFWRAFRLRLWVGLAATLGVLAAWLALMPADNREALFAYWGRVRIPAPGFDLGPIFAAPLSVQVHVLAAMVGLIAGLIIFTLPKGTGFHRFLGWTWVSAMIVVAATSVAMIADFRNGVNALHIFTVLTVVSLWGGLSGIRRGNVRRHAASMVGLYVGGLIIAGITAFIPGRTMWQVVFGG